MSRCVFTLAGRSSSPSGKARISTGLYRLTLTGHIKTESQGDPNAVGRVVPVGVTVVVHDAEVSGIATVRREQPPVGSRTRTKSNKGQPMQKN